MGKFSELVDPTRFSVLNLPGYIFLCGAGLKDKEVSLRACFYEQKVVNNVNLSRRVQLAEKANEWYQANEHFHNLLELEEYLAGLSSYILLFVESAGAIAELGVFTQMSTVKEKLMIVIERSYDKQSFIVDGPIKQMRKLGDGFVLVYPWLLPPAEDGIRRINAELLGDTLDGIAESLTERLDGLSKNETFRRDDHGHKMLLIADLIMLLGIANTTEIKTIVSEQFGFDYADGKLSKYLYLLNQVGIISCEQLGASKYYFGLEEGLPHISYSPKMPTDRTRLRNILREEFPLNAEKRRALNAHKARVSEEAR